MTAGDVEAARMGAAAGWTFISADNQWYYLEKVVS